MKATAKDLRFNSKELLDTVKRGEEVVITFRGKPCAKLIPYEEHDTKNTKKELFGIWKDNDTVGDVHEYVRGLRKGIRRDICQSDVLCGTAFFEPFHSTCGCVDRGYSDFPRVSNSNRK